VKLREDPSSLAPYRGVIRGLREEAERGYTETHLLAAALQEHIDDLRRERDRLLTQVAGLRDDLRRQNASWLERGLKKNR
jgi:hypothetical protein